jgi:predicted phosphodiesterase
VRYGVIADIHANLHALQAVLPALRREGVDRYLCPGDLVGYGAFPNECVELVAGLEAVCVAGNHDLIVLGRLSDARCIALARESLRWTRDELAADARAYLAALPERADVDGGVVVAHGSLDDPQEYVTRSAQAAAQLAQLAQEAAGARHLLLGHTHVARAWGSRSGALDLRAGGRVSLSAPELFLLNPGGVGQSRERTLHARFLVVDLERREATFHAIPYDVEAARAALRRRGLQPASVHLPPSRLRTLARPLGRLKGRVRRLAARRST